MKLILPKQYVDVGDAPLIFLTGPIRGAPLWQILAAEIINEINKDVWIASPSTHSFDKYRDSSIPDNLDKFPRQLNWETYYLEKAGRENGEKRGSVMFWLPKQISPMNVNELTGFPQPYARDTRREFGRYAWGALKNNQNYPITIGYEEGFDGIDVMVRDILAVKPDFVFQKKLEETCIEAVRRALS